MLLFARGKNGRMPDSIIWNRAASSLFPKKEQVTHSESKQPDKKIERDPRREREPLTNRIMLYRYFALREEQHFQWLSDLLESGKIFFPRATRFNDPNEFRFQLRVPKDKEVIRAGWHQDNPHGSKEEFEAWFSSTSFTSWHIYLEPLMHREFLSAFGVVCFSERADSPT